VAPTTTFAQPGVRALMALALGVATMLAPVPAEPRTRFFSGPNVHVFSTPSPFFDLRPIEDQLEIVEREDYLLAIDAWSGAMASAELGIDEEVLWSQVRGRVALVITNRRMLATVPAADWNIRDFQVSESNPASVVVGDRVALIATDRRVLTFEGITGTWSETSLGPRERVLSSAAGTNVAVAVTRTRVLGVAAAAGGVYEAELGIREHPEAVRVHGSFATVETKQRLLTFRAPAGTWSSTDLPFR
jgi:hypothetical protein